MENLSMCRICLTTDVRLCYIASHLQDMYERITAVTFKRDDGRPLVACYICHARLQNCNQLRTSCLRSEELLTEMISSGMLKQQDMLSTNTFRVVSVLHFSLGHALQDSTVCHVKKVPSEVISDAELDQLHSEDILTKAQEEQYAQIENNILCSQLVTEAHEEQFAETENNIQYSQLVTEAHEEQYAETENNIQYSQLVTEAHEEQYAQIENNIQCSQLVTEAHEEQYAQIENNIQCSQLMTEAHEEQNAEIEDNIQCSQLVTEAHEEQYAQIEDNIQCSQLDDLLHTMKEEANDIETDGEYVNVEGNIKMDEISWEPDIIGWDPDVTGPSSQSAENICPKIVKVVLERIDLNDSRVGGFLQSENTEKISIEANSNKPHRNKEAEVEFGEPGSVGARVSKKSKIAALKGTEGATTSKRKIEVIINGQKEIITIKELKIVTNKIEVQKPVIKSKILKTCDKVNNNLNKCDNNILTSVVNDVCKQKSTNDTSFRISSRKKRPFSCDTCNKCFRNKTHLKIHIRTHSSDKPYQCNVCNKCFIYKYVLKKHMLTHSNEKPYECNICDKRFIYQSVLKNHILIHTGKKPYECIFCNKCFTYKHHLQAHIRTHTGDKSYQCKICNKWFGYQNVLNNHILTHTSNKPYQCNVCEKRFKLKDNLKAHFISHSGEKPFQCNVCKRCFSYKSVLITHIRTHTGEKPYQCNVCKKCFKYSSSYSNHIRIHKRQLNKNKAK